MGDCQNDPLRVDFDRQIKLQFHGSTVTTDAVQFGIDHGPVLLMIENYRTGLLWGLMRRCVPVVTRLRRAGFTGGWL